MIALIISMTRQAVADRKGVTALEYALIAAAVAAVVIGSFGGLFGRLQGVLNAITFAPPAGG